MQIERLDIPDIFVVSPRRHGDDRGFFSEVFRADIFAEHGVDEPFVQDNHAFSAHRGVLRGLHFQVEPSAQGKLVRCTQGSILDVAVDIRRGSPTYGKHVTAVISAANWTQLWVPAGFAHGYVTLEANTEVLYKVTRYYDPACEGGIAWNDPDLGIDWRVDPRDVILSPKDKIHPRLADTTAMFVYAG